MGRKLSDRNRRWLAGELMHWQQSGIILPDQARQIYESYESPAETGGRKRRLAGFSLAALAALMVGLAVLLLIGHNWSLVVAGWEAMPRIAKLAAVFAALAGSHAFALWLRFRTPWRLGSEVAFFFACLMFGAGIWLVAQVFHVDAHWPDGIWWWALGTLPVALCMDTLVVHCLLAGLLGFWAGSEVLGFPHMAGFWNMMPNGAYSLLPLAGLGLLWCYRKGSSWGVALYAALLTWWIIVQGFSWGEFFWGREEAGVYFIAATAPLLMLIGENHRQGDPAARPWNVFGSLLTAAMLIPLSFHDFHRWHDYWYYHRSGAEMQHIGGLFVLLIVLAAVAVLLTLLRPRRADETEHGLLPRLGDLARRQWFTLGISLSVIIMGFTDFLAWGMGTETWIPTIIANLAMIALAVWLMYVGLREEQGIVFTAGVGYFILWSILRYCDLFAEAGGMLGAAGMFFLCGVMLFGLSMLWRGRKEWRHV
jgi:uncharacterized membrane protein